MFNKENKKTDFLDENLKSVKFHTMKDDLTHKEENINFEKTVDVKEADQIKGSSPFMNQAGESFNIEAVNAKKDIPNSYSAPAAPLASSPASSYPTFDADQPFGSKSTPKPEININVDNIEFDDAQGKSSVFLYVIILIVILLLGAGGYYFWMVKEGKIEETGLIQDILDYKEGIKETNGDGVNKNIDNNVPVTDLSNVDSGFSDKTNFLVIDNNELTQEGIKAVIDKKFLEMDKYKGNQLEFLVVNKSNKPITFRDFANSFKINLNTTITSNLEMDNFSLFLYKKGNIKRVDLVLSVKNKNLLKANLLNNEKTLVDSLAPLFIYEKPMNVSNMQFKESTYNNSTIRYTNLNKNMDLSLDYSISGDYLILATNKDSGRLIIDKLSSELVKNEKVFTP